MTFNFDALLDAVTWEDTPLGCRSTWPPALEAFLALLKRSRRPQYLVWGPDRRFFYNAAFLPVIGIKHPAGFGMPMAEVWPEVWEDIEPLVTTSIRDGEAHYFEDMPFVLQRHGYDELTYFSFSYTPVQGDDGHVAGLMCVLAERTKEVQAQAQRRSELDRMQRAIEDSRNEARGHERRGKRGGRGKRNEAHPDGRAPQVLGRGQARECREAGHEDRVGVARRVRDFAQPCGRMRVGDVRQRPRHALDATIVRDDGVDSRLRIVDALDVAGERRGWHAQRIGVPQRGTVGEQVDLVSGVDERETQRRQWAHVAFGAVSGDDELHGWGRGGVNTDTVRLRRCVRQRKKLSARGRIMPAYISVKPGAASAARNRDNPTHISLEARVATYESGGHRRPDHSRVA